MPQFAAIGEAMIELSHREEQGLVMDFAGDTINLTTYLTRLTRPEQLQIHYITALGDDPYSEMMLATWAQEGISIHFIPRLAHKLPGLYLIRTNAQGERRFYFYRSESAARELFKTPKIDALCAALVRMDYLYLSSISLAIFDEPSREKLFHLLADAKKQGAKIIFDTNYRPALWPNVTATQTAIRKIAPFIDMVLPTFDDEQAVFDDATPQACAQRWHEWGVKEVAIKQGAAACLVSLAGTQHTVAAEIPERVVDTTAAGDSFNAAYIAARLRNYSPEEAARYGHRLACVVISHPGAIIPRVAMPTLFPDIGK